MLVSGCAKVADPQPPNLTPPATVSDLRLEQSENHIVLDFSLPATYIDGRPLDLNYAAIYRLVLVRTEDPSSATPERMAREGQVITQLWPDDLEKLTRAGRVRFEDVVAFPDPNWIFQRSFAYGLRFYSPRRVGSAFSNLALVAPIAPAAAPRNLTAQPGENVVLLAWDAPLSNLDGSVPPRVTGYRVLRGDSADSLSPLEQIEGGERQYSDRSAVSDRIYHYAVQARSSTDPPSFGPHSAPVAADTSDRFPPAAPEGLLVSVSAPAATLVWEPNSETDLKGYNVYRSDGEQGPFQSMSSTVVNSFTDPSPGPGVFYYRITAVDRRGNEGPPSASVRADLP